MGYTDRKKRKAESLAQSMLGSRKTNSPAAGLSANRKSAGTPSLASRVGVTKVSEQTRSSIVSHASCSGESIIPTFRSAATYQLERRLKLQQHSQRLAVHKRNAPKPSFVTFVSINLTARSRKSSLRLTSKVLLQCQHPEWHKFPRVDRHCWRINVDTRHGKQ